MLRSFTVLDPHLVNSIRENPRYIKMTLEEILGKFVSRRMMIKEARYVDEALNGPIHEPQTVALKATSSRETVGVLGPTAHLGLPLKVFLGVGRCRRL
jgi:hypothetical protein